jgi:hypothetical protein
METFHAQIDNTEDTHLILGYFYLKEYLID